MWSHVFTARTNAGELASLPKVAISTPPLAPNLGSGKPGTPCLRMQRALAIMLAFCVEEIAAGNALAPGRSLAHAL